MFGMLTLGNYRLMPLQFGFIFSEIIKLLKTIMKLLTFQLFNTEINVTFHMRKNA